MSAERPHSDRSTGIDRLHIEVDGESHQTRAVPLIVVNGAWCTTRLWDQVVGRLAGSRMVIRHDVRGTGKSGAGPPTENTFETYADDIIAIGSSLGVERFDLWGMAWGARVALVTAARHQMSVRKLILSDLAIDPADPEAQKAGARAAKAARAEAGVLEPARPIMKQLDSASTTLTLSATERHPDLMPMVRKVSAPTLLATGEFDPNLASTRRAFAGFADATLQVLPLTGHASVLQRPDLCAEMAAAFLND